MTNTMTFFGARKEVAAFVEEMLFSFGVDWRSITITKQVRLGGYFVSIVIDGSWDDTVEITAQNCCLELMNI